MHYILESEEIMIRSDFDISEEDYDKISIPFGNALDEYLRDNFIYDWMAFYIARGYQMDALFKGTLSGVFNAAIDSICDIEFGSDEDIEKLKVILKDKYNLLLISDTHLEIEEIPTRK